MKNIKGIVFDMDGVLVKTIHIAKEVAREKLERYKIKLNKKDYEYLAGFSWKEFLKYIYKSRKLKPIPCLYKDILETYSTALNGQIVLYDRAIELLDALRSHYKLALASGSSKEIIISNLNKFSLRDYFTIILSTEEVEKGKPAPDLYLEACRSLKLKPETCIGIEDSVLGVEAVKNAGMFSIAVTHTVSKDKLKEADAIVNNLMDILSITRRLRFC